MHDEEVDMNNGVYQSGWHRQDGGWQEGPMAQVKIPVNEEVMAGC